MESNKFAITKPNDWKTKKFNQKIQYFMSVITKDFSPYADKIQAKELAKQLCPNIKVAKIIKILKNPNDITQNDIKPNLFLKASHGSSWNIDLKDNNNIHNIKSKLKKWNTHYNPESEPHYSWIEPRFFIEEKINDKHLGNIGCAVAYYFYCVNGIIQFSRVEYHDRIKPNMYDRNWNLIGKHNIPVDFPKPENYDEVVICVEKLAAPFEFVRIDLFLGINNDIYFGEFTFSPNGGKKFLPNFVDRDYFYKW